MARTMSECGAPLSTSERRRDSSKILLIYMEVTLRVVSIKLKSKTGTQLYQTWKNHQPISQVPKMCSKRVHLSKMSSCMRYMTTINNNF